MAASLPLRRTIGLAFLLSTVVSWTTSGFLTSSIFADGTYAKPFLVIYLNTSFFALNLIPHLAWKFIKARRRSSDGHGYRPIAGAESEPLRADTGSLAADSLAHESDRDYSAQHGNGDGLRSDAAALMHSTDAPAPPLTERETIELGAKFAVLWFLANYFNTGCLQYTSVASSMILSCTSSIFVLVFGAFANIEKFTLRKLACALSSLAGVALIAFADASDADDSHRGTFPYKSPGQIALGDAMALLAAALYGVYTVALVKKVGDETRVNMQLFFASIGVFSIVCLWPVVAVLHWTGVERFELPPTSHVWAIVLGNAIISLVGDMSWGFSNLFISPMIVTIGLSLSIPLSLIGQIALDSQWVGPLYYCGAAIVLASFIFINYESGTNVPVTAEQIPT